MIDLERLEAHLDRADALARRDPQRSAQLVRQGAELSQDLGLAEGRHVFDQAS